MAIWQTFTHDGKLYHGPVIKGVEAANRFMEVYDNYGVLKVTHFQGWSEDESVVYMARLDDMGKGSTQLDNQMETNHV